MPEIPALTIFKDFSLDGVIILCLFGALLLYGLRYGKRRILTLTLSLYVALLVYMHFPYELDIFAGSAFQSLFAGSAVFGGFTAFVYLTIARSVHAEFPYNRVKRYTEAGVLSACAAGLLLAFSYHVLPVSTLYDFNPQIDTFFASSKLFFWWLVIPLVGLFFLARR